MTLGACASYDLTALPMRDAELYPRSRTERNISVAAQAFSDPSRVRAYFGTNLLAYNVLPIEVTVSNHGDQPIRVEPSEILLMHGEEVVDPLPVGIVAQLPIRDRWFVSSAARRQLREFYDALSFKEATVASGSTYHGVMFFGVPEPRSPIEKALHVWQPFSMPELYLTVAVEDENGAPLRFGPFGLLGTS